MSRVRFIVSLGLLASLGCNANNGSAISYAFNRPERVDFACLAQYASTTPLAGQYVVIPTACCNRPDPSTTATQTVPSVPPECLEVNKLGLATPLLHALVTQSTRGEVAAVDLVRNRVLDSDRQVPGFTFLDSGGLPTAIVVPPRQPRSELVTGPAFFYVASGEDHVIRAIPTCHLRSGVSCGPDRLSENADAAYASRLRVPLRGAPEDMLLGPDEALWVTVPERGLIARIGLPKTPDTGAVDAFDLDAMRAVPEPTWFSVPAMPNVAPPAPVAEEDVYTTSCGLGVAYEQVSFTLPNAPRVPAPGTSEPTRLKYDATSKLLLVADRTAPGLNAFRMGEDGSLVALGALPTGQPIREFVLTPPVPTHAIQGGALVARTVPPDDPATETKRYLYAIDALGTVMVFAFEADPAGGLPRLTPLLVPAPDLAVARYADRIALPQPSQTLEIVDSRPLSDYVCGQDALDDLKARDKVLREELKGLPPGEAHDARARELERVDARLAIHDNADSAYLRGVFVAVASTAGVLSVVDVHDLDAACRAQKFCCASEPTLGDNNVPVSCTQDHPEGLLVPRSADAQKALMIRRHTVRRRNASKQTADVASSNLLAPQNCADNDRHAAADLSGQVCAPVDPYSTLNETWRVLYEDALPNSQTGYAYWDEPTADEAMADAPNLLALEAPAELDFCARGVEPGDLVAVIGRAPEGLRATCPDPGSDSAPTFIIKRATNHRLLVSPRPSAGETSEALRDRVLRCYPDYVGVELRAHDFMVLGTSGTYLHRIVSNADGVCVADPAQDPLFNSRVRVDDQDGSLVFQNPFVRFKLAPAAGDVQGNARETSITVSRASTALALTTVIAGDRVTDALPSTLRYLPDMGYLFLLDTAGQGLRRYTLEPFQRDTTVFR